MASKVTAPSLRAMRESGKPIVCITAYDATFGAIADEAGADVILVGDSVGNVMLGYSSTIPVTLEQIVHHTRATRSGVKRALLVADLPFGSYEVSVAQAMESAFTLMKAGAEAVKLEGEYPEAVQALVKAGIPVVGHIGMTPQSINQFGGPKIQGTEHNGDDLVNTAVSLDGAGVCGIVLELIPAELSARVTDEVACPTIGIGAGPCCSGQIQVLHDVLGLSERVFKHAKPFASGRQSALDAVKSYAAEVRSKEFPTSEQSF